MIRTNRNTQFTSNTLIPFKGNLHLRSVNVERLRGTDGDAGCAMGAPVLMPLDILGQRLNLHSDFAEIFKPCLDIRPLSGDLQDQPPLFPGVILALIIFTSRS